MSLLDSSAKLASYLETWKEVNRSQESPVDIVEKIADLLESEAEARQSLDPDPFDDRPLARTEPESVISHLLRSLYDNIEFRTKLTSFYIFHGSSDFKLNCAASRVLVILLHAFTDNQIVELFTESNVGRLMSWAKDGKEPLRSYSCALLAPAIQTPDCPGLFKETNATLVPILIKRLHCLSQVSDLDSPCVQDFTSLEKTLSNQPRGTKRKAEKSESQQKQKADTPGVSRTPNSSRKRKLQQQQQQQQVKPLKNFEYDKPTMSMNPLTVGRQQRLILGYLHPLGEYQEALPIALESNVIDLVFHYIDPKAQTDPNLACSALLYLSSLLCHKKFISEFVSQNGIQKILEIPQPSAVATMSSLCLYYITFNEDVVEKICQFPSPILHQLVEYLLWLLECSHISGRCHAALFFSMTFPFKAILQLFDSMDGLRKVVNMISTLKIVRVNESNLTEHEDVFLDREIAKNACLTLKNYFEAHITLLSSEYKNASLHYPCQEVPAYKPLIITAESIYESIECIICNEEEGPGSSHEKQIIKKCLTLGLPQLLLQLLSLSADWVYNSKIEVMLSILDTLLAMSSSKKIALSFCQQIPVGINETQPGIKVLLRGIEGDLVYDIDLQQSALKVLCSCVTSKDFLQQSISDNLAQRLNTKDTTHVRNNYMQKIWSIVRLNNGIMILLALLKIRTPITEADSVRSNVCKALCGLSENDLICQILGKLPIFHNDQWQILMREPILSDRINEHIRFCKYASMLIERVTGKPSKLDYNDTNPMLSRIAKAGIVSQTKIMYPQKELLTIIYNHLQSQGLVNAASALKVEANLTVDEKTAKEKEVLPSTPYSTLPRDLFTRPTNNNSTSTTPLTKEPIALTPFPMTPFQSRRMSTSVGSQSYTSPQLDHRNERKLLFTPKRKLVQSPSVNPSSVCLPAQTPSSSYQKCKVEDKLKSLRRNRVTTPPPTLDKIVKSFLRDQHSKCSNPVVTCPPFSLLRSHHCPEPLYRTYASQNIAKRLMTRQLQPRFGGRQGSRHNRNFLYSRFRTVGLFKEPRDEECMFTSCAWLPDGSTILGNKSGEIRVMSNYLGEVEVVQQAHDSGVASINVSRNAELMTTSAYDGVPLGCLWTLRFEDDNTLKMELKHEYEADGFLKFNSTQDRILGTDEYTARLYDLGSGNRPIATFSDPNNANNYTKNVACFGPCDDLVLNDGCLWDVRAKNMIHKFDKFNDLVSGVFHPSGLEIIINSEVWDIRTFHLLDTVPALDRCQIVFSNKGDIIYAVKHCPMDAIEELGGLGPFESSFRTFDSYDYSAIGTVDTKKQIFDICPDFTDECLAVIENGPLELTTNNYTMDTTCRLYDIGRIKQRGELSDEEQDEESEHSSAENNMDSPEDLMDLITNMLSNDGYEDFDEDDDEFEVDDDDYDDDEEEEEDNDGINTDDDVTIDEDDVTIDEFDENDESVEFGLNADSGGGDENDSDNEEEDEEEQSSRSVVEHDGEYPFDDFTGTQNGNSTPMSDSDQDTP